MKTSGFKKVLALVIAIAMVLSVCTMSFTVNAAADMSYFVMNDGTLDGGWTNGSNQTTSMVTDGVALRVAPQRTGTSQMSVKLNKDGADFASVNTLSYYVKNETGAPLMLRYQYYLSNGSSGYFNGYVYLVGTDEADIVPYKADAKGNITLPAKFEGYVIYDLAKSDNYGNVSLNQGDGNWDTTNTVVDYLKAQSFSGMSLFYEATDAMLSKAWYLDSVAVSTKTVEELAKFLTGCEIVSYNFNMANARGWKADESMMYYGAKFAETSGDTLAEIVDTDNGGLDGQASKFTVVNQKGGQAGYIDVRDSFMAAYGTDLPFAIENAKGYKFDIEQTGNVGFDFLVKGEGNTIQGTKYFVATDGTVTTSMPSNFKGTVYCVFNDDDTTIKHQWGASYHSWADYVGERKDSFNMSMYTGEKGAPGSTIALGGFSFIYDVTDFENKLNAYAESLEPTNKVFIDGTVLYEGWFKPSNGYAGYGSQNGRIGQSIVDGEIVFKLNDETKTDVSGDWLYFNQGSAKHTVENPEDVKALAFYLRLEGVDSSATKAVWPGLNTENKYSLVGSAKAIGLDGKVVATYESTSARKDDDPDTPGGKYSTYTEKPYITVPGDFEGLIVVDLTSDCAVTGDYHAKTDYLCYSFAEWVSVVGNGQIGVVNDKGSFSSAINANTRIVYDDVTLVYDDVDTFVNEYLATEKMSAKLEAQTNALLEGSHIVNTFTGASGNTAGISSGSRVGDVNYGFNDSADMLCAEFTYSAAEAKSTQRRIGVAVNQGSLDLSTAVGFTYEVNITNPDGFNADWSHQGPGQEHGIGAKVYFVDANTGAVTDMGSKFSSKKALKGTVVVLFNSDVAVSATWGDKGSWSWADFVAHKSGKVTGIGLWINQDRATTTVTEGETTKTVLTDACANFKVQFDNLAFIYEKNPVLDKINAVKDTKTYVNPANDISSLGQYSSAVTYPAGTFDETAPYDVEVVAMDNLPTGSAFKFTRNANKWVAGRQIFVGNKSTLTADEIKSLEALVYWVKVPEGKKVQLGRYIGGEGKSVQTSSLLYDTVKKQFTVIGGAQGTDNSIISGFEGYVIIPLKNAYIKDTLFSEAYGTVFTSLYPYFYIGNDWNYTAPEWYLGDVRAIKSLDEFYAELGAETTPGDLNNDSETDLRDVVRLKKYNTDPKTSIAYQNADVDGNGIIDTAAELVNIKKQNMGVDYKATEKDASLVDYPDTFVGLYHASYGSWNSKYADIADESAIVNMYSSVDLYTLAQLKENGGNTWFYLSESYDGEPVFGTKDGGYDREATEINEAYKTKLDNTVKKLKSLGLWNVVLGFTDEEILIGDQKKGMTQAQFAIWTKYLAETYGKRFNACLSTYEVKGNAGTNTSAANAETYAYVTDIGYDLYGSDLDANTTMFNTLKANIGNRTDIKYWFYPTAYSPKDALGNPSYSDETIANQIRMFDTLFSDTSLIPESQRGGLYFYTWSDWDGSFGLESLIEDYNYTATRDALVEVASKWAK